jgi:hypothetical protein
MNYLTQKPKSDVYYANLTIPPELRHIIGRGVRFFQSTKTKSYPEALRRGNALVTGWKAEISKAKGQLPNAKDDFWESLRRDYMNAKDEGTEFAIQDIAEKASLKVKDPNEALNLYKFATDQVGTLLAPLVEDWKASLRLAQKSIDQHHRDVVKMADHFVSLEAIKPQAVKAWTDKLILEGMTSGSLVRIVGGCRSLWRYLQEATILPMDTPDPFVGSFRLATKTATKVTVDRKAFTADELVKVYDKALTNDDEPLARLIALGAFTGARIEEICSLKVENCQGGLFHITDSKTDAGIREVPIHPALVPLVAKMTKESTDGYLVPSKAGGQYGVRSDPYSKRFGRLKGSMGFGPGHVFHSIRKTVATLLEQADVKEGIAADILGHEKKTLSYGLYSSGSSMAQKLEAISKVTYPGALGKP